MARVATQRQAVVVRNVLVPAAAPDSSSNPAVALPPLADTQCRPPLSQDEEVQEDAATDVVHMNEAQIAQLFSGTPLQDNLVIEELYHPEQKVFASLLDDNGPAVALKQEHLARVTFQYEREDARKVIASVLRVVFR